MRTSRRLEAVTQTKCLNRKTASNFQIEFAHVSGGRPKGQV
jgi:hypothetical protein